jgi:hypothetical protein
MGVTVLVALAATPGVGWLIESMYDERAARAAVLAEGDARIRDEMLELGWTPLSGTAPLRLENSRGVELFAARSEFSLELANGAVRGRAPSSSERVAELVAAELERYPRAFLEAARLQRVVLCSGLSEGGVVIPSLPNFHRSLLLDVDADAAYLRRLVHHEVFHFADYADDDQVQRDPQWAALNDRWFVYGSGGRFVRDPASSHKSERDGFVTRYAESALEEDKAETFAFVMTEPAWIEARGKSDAVLARKVFAVKRQLERLDPSLGERFWTAQVP